MSRNRSLGLLVVLTSLASVLSIVLVGRPEAAATPLVRPDSHRLAGSASTGAGTVQLVEFIDFECRRCHDAHPFIDDLREDYAGRVDLVVRYFPLPGHANSTRAAVAVEAAARQGRFEEMAAVLWATHGHWGRSQESAASLFRSFAVEMGLDLVAYDDAVADPATEARVRTDFQDGVALGVGGTPTYFLDGELVRPVSEEHFRQLLDAALATRGGRVATTNLDAASR